MDRVSEVIDRYGPAKAIVLARFIPVVRTVMNPMAGMIGVSTKLFTFWQIIGGLLWTVSVTMAGYWLGSQITGIDKYLLPIIAVVVVISLIPVVLELRRLRRDNRARPSGPDRQSRKRTRTGVHCMSTTISYAEAIVVGAFQGVTELFPVSSLGHSIIIPGADRRQLGQGPRCLHPGIAVPGVHRRVARGHGRGAAGVLLAGLGTHHRRILLRDPPPPHQDRRRTAGLR